MKQGFKTTIPLDSARDKHHEYARRPSTDQRIASVSEPLETLYLQESVFRGSLRRVTRPASLNSPATVRSTAIRNLTLKSPRSKSSSHIWPDVVGIVAHTSTSRQHRWRQ